MVPLMRHVNSGDDNEDRKRLKEKLKVFSSSYSKRSSKGIHACSVSHTGSFEQKKTKGRIKTIRCKRFQEILFGRSCEQKVYAI